MDFILRPAGAADYEWLWNLKRLTMRPYVEQTWGIWDDFAQEEFFRHSYRAESVQVVVVDRADAGLLHVEREPQELFLANIQIHPDFQNRGLGSAVVRTVIETGRQLRLPIRLQVLRVNTRARLLYERLGFSVSNDTGTHTIMRKLPAA
jgi:ribosomal protein S18 acetylase RimI-like enzyme